MNNASETASFLTERVYNRDKPGKSLTGRTVETLVFETEIPAEELFPLDTRILYIGDPWQKMGLELDASHGDKLTLIDYEYGEVASFVTEPSEFFEGIEKRTSRVLTELHNCLTSATPYSDEQLDAFDSLFSAITTAAEPTTVALQQDRFKETAALWDALKQQVETCTVFNGNPYETKLIKDMWYLAVFGARGLTDIYDWETSIKPQLEKAEWETQHLPQQEQAQFLRLEEKRLIEEQRMHKKPEQANVVQAVFPQLPFADASFGRVVASWSISAHIFNGMTFDEYFVCWKELFRVLEPAGEAIVFPLNYYYYPDFDFVSSLEEMTEQHNDFEFEVLDQNGSPIPKEYITYEDDNAYTLIISKLELPQEGLDKKNEGDATG